MLATFYSFKGGVGRSMAMANVAEILAGWGYRVVVCDWDLEAPGIERYVFDRPEELEDARRGTGIVDLISEYKAAIAAPPPPEGAPPPGDGYVKLGNLWIRRPQSCCLTVPPPCRPKRGWVGMLPSGRRHNAEALAKYSETVRGFDWNDFCQNWGGGAYLEFFRNDLGGAERFADFILVDSRTGLTEVGGVCTHFLADAVVLCCAGNEQNIEGTRDMARMLSRETLVAERGGRALAVLPVASRIERSSEIEYLLKFEQQFLAEFARYIPPEVAEKMGGAEGFIRSSLIPYIPKYSFSETLVARKPPGERHRELYSAYEAIARSLVHWGAAKCGIDDAGLHDPSSQATQPVPIARTSSILPRGRYYLAAHSADAEAARMLAGELRGAGLDLWWDDCERTSTRGVARLSVAREAAGMLLLAPQKPDRDWLDSELNRTLALQAARPAFRPLLLLPPGAPQPDLLQAQRFRRLQLPADTSASVAARIFAELLPEPALPPESPDLEVLNTLVSPVESHSRFCLGREEELSRIVGELEGQLESGPVAEVIVSGSAASGKSALVRGGLIPLFRAASIGPNAVSWQAAYVRITSDEPLAAIVRALAAATGCTLRGSTPAEQSDELRAHLSAGTQPVALILDKVEDIPNRHGFDDTRTSDCYKALISLGSAAGAGFALVVCIRARFLAELARLFPDLARHTVSLDPPNSAIMRTMLEGGARLFGQRIEAGLIDRIIGDIARVRENSRLPGLVLRKLIENRENDTSPTPPTKPSAGSRRFSSPIPPPHSRNSIPSASASPRVSSPPSSIPARAARAPCRRRKCSPVPPVFSPWATRTGGVSRRRKPSRLSSAGTSFTSKGTTSHSPPRPWPASRRSASGSRKIASSFRRRKCSTNSPASGAKPGVNLPLPEGWT
jgi:riboflavin biosynthesis pyrimidine reductase